MCKPFGEIRFHYITEVSLDRDAILEKITLALSDIIDRPDLTLTESTTADEVEEWDSLNHVKLMIEIENELGIRFATNEISAPENVGKLIDLIQQKL